MELLNKEKIKAENELFQKENIIQQLNKEIKIIRNLNTSKKKDSNNGNILNIEDNQNSVQKK